MFELFIQCGKARTVECISRTQSRTPFWALSSENTRDLIDCRSTWSSQVQRSVGRKVYFIRENFKKEFSSLCASSVGFRYCPVRSRSTDRIIWFDLFVEYLILQPFILTMLLFRISNVRDMSIVEIRVATRLHN